MRTIAFLSQKGGCGKTTSCINLAAALAEIGRRVLLVDLDSNACASRTFGFIEDWDHSLVAALLGDQPITHIIRETEVERVWLTPGAPGLSVIDKLAVATPDRADENGYLSDIALTLEIHSLGEAYDYILMDCPGGHPFIQRLALLACNEVIVPTGLSVYDLYAATPTLQMIVMAQQVGGEGHAEFSGFLPNGAAKRGVPQQMQKTLDQHKMPCFTPIRQSALLKTMPGRPQVRQRIMVLARPEHPVTERYRQVAQEIEIGIDEARQLRAQLAHPPASYPSPLPQLSPTR